MPGGAGAPLSPAPRGCGPAGWCPHLPGLFFEGRETLEQTSHGRACRWSVTATGAAAFAQPGLSENLAKFGPDPPAQRENSGRAEGSERRPFLSCRLPGTERERPRGSSQEPGGGNSLSVPARPLEGLWRAWYPSLMLFEFLFQQY